MPELVAVIEAGRNQQSEERKFFAALEGVDLDKSTSGNEWEEMKSRVFGGANAQNSNDITSLQGRNAARAGFGIGAGRDYEVM